MSDGVTYIYWDHGWDEQGLAVLFFLVTGWVLSIAYERWVDTGTGGGDS